MSDAPLVVGWREWIALPRMGIPRIKAKLDTGARTSSLHATVGERFSRAGTEMIEFVVHPDPFGEDSEIRVVAPIADERNVRSSNGSIERRLFIVSEVAIGDRRWDIEVSLTSRESMAVPMLLGRQALRGRVLVDSARSYLTSGRDKRSAMRTRNRR